jgi:hypothetical protein
MNWFFIASSAAFESSSAPSSSFDISSAFISASVMFFLGPECQAVFSFFGDFAEERREKNVKEKTHQHLEVGKQAGRQNSRHRQSGRQEEQQASRQAGMQNSKQAGKRPLLDEQRMLLPTPSHPGISFSATSP